MPSELDGSNPRQLTSLRGTYYIAGPQWSPDGQSIAVTVFENQEPKVGIITGHSGALRILSIAGGASGHLGRETVSGCISQRTMNMAHRFGRCARPGGESLLIKDKAREGYDMPQPSPDGKFIYFNKGWPGPLSVWRISVSGGEETKIIEGVSLRGQWGVGPNGIYFYAMPDSQGRSEMRMYEYATDKITKILIVDRGAEFRVAVSPDGRTIYYPQIDYQGSDLTLVENFR